MAPIALNLPAKLKTEAEQWAVRQGITLDELVVWALAEKLGELKKDLDDPRFPLVTYRRGAAGEPVPVLRGTGVRVQTVVAASRAWKMSPSDIAAEYDLTPEQVAQAFAFHAEHRGEIEAALAEERQLENAHG